MSLDDFVLSLAGLKNLILIDFVLSTHLEFVVHNPVNNISLVLYDLRVETCCTIVYTKPISADFYVHTLHPVVVHNIVPYIGSVHICTVPIGGNCTL